ncbi:uncharacterized protein LOC143536708 [Bidens hawaiensis]|uniref:uncharacterized protein LOC143536708 n=1 Tax=Bidens hawaiensis TaxID=980011 RepID=UPI00404B4FD9
MVLVCNCNTLNHRIIGDNSFRLDMFSDIVNLNFTLPNTSLSSEDIRHAAVSAAAPVALLMLISIIYSISGKKNIGTDINVDSDSDDDDDEEDIFWQPASDVLHDELMLEEDAKYAQELQLEEALLASQNSNTNRRSLASLLNIQVVCKICFENHESRQMFKNPTCSHWFCYNCTIRYATTKIQEHNRTIACPGINCSSALDFNSLRVIIPRVTLVKWDELLCESSICESNKLYCPFTDCSVLLINDDTSNSITKIDCPMCRRSFCASCRVPWHSEFSCKEFGKLKETGDDEMAVALVEKKMWKKCPNCNFFVEKTEGCSHITCRCKHEFCYTCGDKWGAGHSGCSSSRVEQPLLLPLRLLLPPPSPPLRPLPPPPPPKGQQF